MLCFLLCVPSYPSFPPCSCPLVDLNLGKVIHVDMYDAPAVMPPTLVS